MKLTNVVYQGDMNCEINLKDLTQNLTNIRYDPRTFPGVIYQNRKIGGNCLIFSNGKINCNGYCENFMLGRKRLRQYARIIQKLGYTVTLTKVRLVTASAVHKLSGRVNVNTLSRFFTCSYDPELFPAVMFRRKGIHFTCHLKGTILITGIKRARNIDDIVYPALVEIETCL